jgi:hypothetical protein
VAAIIEGTALDQKSRECDRPFNVIRVSSDLQITLKESEDDREEYQKLAKVLIGAKKLQNSWI